MPSPAARHPSPLLFSTVVAAAAAGVALVGGAGAAHADRRSFAHTYEYSTTPEGQTEIELASEQDRLSFDGATSPQTFGLELEVEHGITDRWDIALYHVFAQSTDGAGGGTPFGLDEVKVETRYRLKERGELPVDVLLYGELAKDFGAGVYELEGKVILARDFGRATAAANLIGELEFGNDVDEPELELGWSAGVTYEASPTWKFGAETWGSYADEETAGAGESEATAASAGPALSWAPSSRLWVTGTAGFGITDEAPAFSARAIIGLGL